MYLVLHSHQYSSQTVLQRVFRVFSYSDFARAKVNIFVAFHTML